MKKALAFLVVGFVCFGSCSVQNANAQSSNDAQRIVGTWVGIESTGFGVTAVSYTFNSDGTIVIKVGERSVNGNYFINNSKIFYRTDNSATGLNYYFSSNGRILFLQGPAVVIGTWLEKQ